MRIVIDMTRKTNTITVVGTTLASAEDVKRLLDTLCAAAEELWPGGLDAYADDLESPPEGSMN